MTTAAAKVGFADFQRFAIDPKLSKYERIGFPNAYREGFEPAIFSDISAKLPSLSLRNQNVLDIGPGCSDLPRLLISHCADHDHHLTLIDSAEMLALLPSENLERVAALFPKCPEFISSRQGTFDAILCYSVLHYVIHDTSLVSFYDAALSLLAPRGQMLIGDIPNISKRKRFFSSESGKHFHRDFMGVDEDPAVQFNRIEEGEIDDAVMAFLVQRARAAGFDAYMLPQSERLPMANRREDLLVVRP